MVRDESMKTTEIMCHGYLALCAIESSANSAPFCPFGDVEWLHFLFIAAATPPL